MLRAAIGLAFLTTAGTVAHADDVLVWADATFATDIAPGGETVQLSTAPRDAGNAFVMHLVGPATGGFVEVETGAHGCSDYGVSSASEISALHLFVREADLAPVVTRDWTAAWKDGGSISLVAGTPIDRAAKAVRLGKLAIPVDIPADLIGTQYAPQPAKVLPYSGSDTHYAIGGKLPFGPHAVAGDLESFAIRKLPHDKVAFPFHGACLFGEIVVDKHRVKATSVAGDPEGVEGGEVGGVAGGVLEEGAVTRYVLPYGTPMTTRGGTHVVAKVATVVDVPRQDAAARVACHRFNVYIEGWGVVTEHAQRQASVMLCAPGSAVMKQQR